MYGKRECWYIFFQHRPVLTWHSLQTTSIQPLPDVRLQRWFVTMIWFIMQPIWRPKALNAMMKTKQSSVSRHASFIKPLMAEQRRHVLCVGVGGNWTHSDQVRMWLDPAFALTARLRGWSAVSTRLLWQTYYQRRDAAPDAAPSGWSRNLIARGVLPLRYRLISMKKT